MAKTAQVTTKYYYTADANARHALGELHFKFRRVNFSSGTWIGTYFTDDPERQEALAHLEKTVGLINEISEEDYNYYMANMDDSPMKTADKQPRVQKMLVNAPPELPEPQVQNVDLELTDKAVSGTEHKKKPRRAQSATKKGGVDPVKHEDDFGDDL